MKPLISNANDVRADRLEQRARLESQAGHQAAAITLVEQAIDILQSKYGSEHLELVPRLSTLAEMHYAQNQ